MATSFTAQELRDRLSLYTAAEQAILQGGQSYRIGDRMMTRADLEQIRAEISGIATSIATLESTTGRSRIRYVVPL